METIKAFGGKTVARAPKGGFDHPVNNRAYKGGQFCPLYSIAGGSPEPVVEAKLKIKSQYGNYVMVLTSEVGKDGRQDVRGMNWQTNDSGQLERPTPSPIGVQSNLYVPAPKNRGTAIEAVEDAVAMVLAGNPRASRIN